MAEGECPAGDFSPPGLCGADTVFNQPANARREYGFHRMAHWQQRFHGAQGFCEYTYPRQTPDAVQHREVLNPLSPVQHRLVLTILGEAFRSAGKTSWSENRHS